MDECPACGRPVRTFYVEGEDGVREPLQVDPLPSVHGYVRRTDAPTNLAKVEERRAPGLWRPHHEGCLGG